LCDLESIGPDYTLVVKNAQSEPITLCNLLKTNETVKFKSESHSEPIRSDIQSRIDHISSILENRANQIHSELQSLGYEAPVTQHSTKPLDHKTEPVETLPPLDLNTKEPHEIVELSDRVLQLISEYNSTKVLLFEAEIRYSLAESYLVLGIFIAHTDSNLVQIGSSSFLRIVMMHSILRDPVNGQVPLHITTCPNIWTLVRCLK
jgi:hypothetical protein